MKTYITLDPYNYIRLNLNGSCYRAIGLNQFLDHQTISTAQYGSVRRDCSTCIYPESRGFDRPWPFGPESTQQ